MLIIPPLDIFVNDEILRLNQWYLWWRDLDTDDRRNCLDSCKGSENIERLELWLTRRERLEQEPKVGGDSNSDSKIVDTLEACDVDGDDFLDYGYWG